MKIIPFTAQRLFLLAIVCITCCMQNASAGNVVNQDGASKHLSVLRKLLPGLQLNDIKGLNIVELRALYANLFCASGKMRSEEARKRAEQVSLN